MVAASRSDGSAEDGLEDRLIPRQPDRNEQQVGPAERGMVETVDVLRERPTALAAEGQRERDATRAAASRGLGQLVDSIEDELALDPGRPSDPEVGPHRPSIAGDLGRGCRG
jgi:hypothetical protein